MQPFIQGGCTVSYKRPLCGEFMVGESYQKIALEKCFVANNDCTQWTPKFNDCKVFGFGGRIDPTVTTTKSNNMYIVNKVEGTPPYENKVEFTANGHPFAVYGSCERLTRR
jgi:hypothetical protein